MIRKFNKTLVSGLSILASLSSAFAQPAKIQIVHNSPVAPSVDIFVGSSKFVSNLAFRKATTFRDAPSGVELQVRIKPASNSNDTSAPVFFKRYTLAAGEKYTLVANGLLTTNGYAANPNGRDRAFDITVASGAKESSASAGKTELRVFHTVTDAPKVDVKVLNGPTLVNDAGFRDFTPYLPVDALNYVLQVTAESGAPVVSTFEVPLNLFKDSALTVFASGFLTPSANQNGQAFSLLAVTAKGNAINLTPTSTAMIQVVHNSPTAPAVDIFVDGLKSVSNLAFRKATSFVPAPAGVDFWVRIKPASNSNDTSNPVFRRKYNLVAGEKYVLVANGLLSTQGYAANPNGKNTAFDITVMPGAKLGSDAANKTQFRVFHGATDAPAVDVKVAGGGPTLVDSATFRDFTPYRTVDAINYTLNVFPNKTNTIAASFDVPLSLFKDSALTVLASGFLAPGSNQNGPVFSLLAVTAKGQTINLEIVSVAGKKLELPVSIYPNPSQNDWKLDLTNNSNALTIELMDVSGRILSSTKAGESLNESIILNGEGLNKGFYFVRISDSKGASLVRTLVKD